MNTFNREGKFGRRSSGGRSEGRDRRSSGRSFGGGRGGDRDSGRRTFEKHKVTCDKCGQTCEVPFKPTSGKPVYCSECFRNKDSSDSRRMNQNPGQSNENYDSGKPDKYKQEFEQINEKLDKILDSLGLD